MDWQNFKCRCSAISKLLAASRSNPCLTEIQAKKLDELEKKPSLTEKQKDELADLLVRKENSKKDVLSDTAREYLMEYYSWETERKLSVGKELNLIEYVDKGIKVEEQSVTLLSLIDQVYYHKNEGRVSNDFLSGIPDVFLGEKVMGAKKITDIKSIWDYPTFLKRIDVPLDLAWDYQVKGYLDISEAPIGEIAQCLVSMPEIIINDYKRRLFYKMAVATEEAPEYLQAVEIMERSLRFDDIEKSRRVYKTPVYPFLPEQKQKVYDRVKVARDFLYKFDEKMKQLNK